MNGKTEREIWNASSLSFLFVPGRWMPGTAKSIIKEALKCHAFLSWCQLPAHAAETRCGVIAAAATE
jgi:hypothetical protein